MQRQLWLIPYLDKWQLKVCNPLLIYALREWFRAVHCAHIIKCYIYVLFILHFIRNLHLIFHCISSFNLCLCTDSDLNEDLIYT